MLLFAPYFHFKMVNKKALIFLFDVSVVLLVVSASFILGIVATGEEVSNVFDYDYWSKTGRLGFANVDENTTFNFDKSAVDYLNKKFDETGELEYFVCLEGMIENNTVYVMSADDASYEIGNATYVNRLSCSDDKYVGALHKHPNGVPYPSREDVVNGYLNKEENILINVIHYDEDKFNIMTRENWRYGTLYEYKLGELREI